MTWAAFFYARLQACAREIARSQPPLAFYREEAEAVARSREIFDTAPLVLELRRDLEGVLDEGYGHGIRHAAHVALDAGALCWIEGRAVGGEEPALRRRVEIAHAAGLLHDVLRREENHAERGAALAVRFLSGRRLRTEEIEDIRVAIRNHEAFKPAAAVDSRQGALLSDCLYDADKFRWGPDNFTDTLWEMVASSRMPPEELLARWPAGIESLKRIRGTFRTSTGQRRNSSTPVSPSARCCIASFPRRSRGCAPNRRPRVDTSGGVLL